MGSEEAVIVCDRAHAASGDITRRSFVRTFTGGLLGGVLLYAFPEHARARYIVSFDERVEPDDELFWGVVRRQFPLTEDPVFLNNGTMGPSPYVVIDAVRNEMEEVERRARYGGWEGVRGKIARFINAGEDEVSLTHNVTEGINIVAAGLPLQRGDEVLLTDHEHAGNAIPWLARAKRDGIRVKPVVLAPTAAETLDRISDLITPRTRAIAVPHITCTIGQVLPAREICRLGHDRGLWVFLDGAHTPGMLPLDVKQIGCDFFASCGHKWMMGPKGTGFLYIRRELIETLEPIWVGAGVDKEWSLEKGTLSYRSDAHRFDFATRSAPLSVGLGAATDFLSHLGMPNVARRGRALAAHLRDALIGFGDRVDILTPEEEESCGSILAFRFRTIPYDVLHHLLLEKYGIITRMVPENGVNCNRISTHIYNSYADVDRLVAALRGAAGM